MNYGYQNEIDFVNFFNEKYLHELDDNSQKFLIELFDNEIDNNNLIKAWKNKMNQKADFFIKYGNRIKSISLKCGKNNSIHCENIQEFKRYLTKFNIPFKIVDYYTCYHYRYDRDLFGNTNFNIQLSSEKYKKKYQYEIDIFNKYINKTRIIIDMIDRFIVRGRNSDYDIDAFISGTTNDYIWLLKYEIYDLVLSKRCLDYTSPHIACMTIGPQKRNLNHNSEYAKERFQVCIRWWDLRKDIEEFKENRNN